MAASIAIFLVAREPALQAALPEQMLREVFEILDGLEVEDGPRPRLVVDRLDAGGRPVAVDVLDRCDGDGLQRLSVDVPEIDRQRQPGTRIDDGLEAAVAELLRDGFGARLSGKAVAHAGGRLLAAFITELVVGEVELELRLHIGVGEVRTL